MTSLACARTEVAARKQSLCNQCLFRYTMYSTVGDLVTLCLQQRVTYETAKIALTRLIYKTDKNNQPALLLGSLATFSKRTKKKKDNMRQGHLNTGANVQIYIVLTAIIKKNVQSRRLDLASQQKAPFSLSSFCFLKLRSRETFVLFLRSRAVSKNGCTNSALASDQHFPLHSCVRRLDAQDSKNRPLFYTCFPPRHEKKVLSWTGRRTGEHTQSVPRKCQSISIKYTIAS